MRVNGVLETCLYATNLDEAENFYNTVVGLELVSKLSGRHTFFRCGAGMLLLFNPDATESPSGDIPTHGARGPGHVAFAIDNDAYRKVRDSLNHHNIPVEREITWDSGVLSIYVRDPAGNSVEFSTPALWGIL